MAQFVEIETDMNFWGSRLFTDRLEVQYSDAKSAFTSVEIPLVSAETFSIEFNCHRNGQHSRNSFSIFLSHFDWGFM